MNHDITLAAHHHSQ